MWVLYTLLNFLGTRKTTGKPKNLRLHPLTKQSWPENVQITAQAPPMGNKDRKSDHTRCPNAPRTNELIGDAPARTWQACRPPLPTLTRNVNSQTRISWTLGSCATLPVCQFRCHPTKHFHQSQPVSGVGCGESSSTVPMEYTIKCQYTCDHYVNVRDTQTDRHCYYHWTSHTWIDLIGLRVDTFTETWSQQGTNRTLGGSSHLREITKISTIHCWFVLERKTVFRYVFSLDDQSHIHFP
jgi:hypothetical protein